MAVDVDRLSYEIFSILESKFLFGYDDSSQPSLLSSASPAGSLPLAAGPGGRVCILSIDGGGRPSDALLSAASLARLESYLQRRSGNPSARVADFFDVAAGSGAGGVLAAMLFSRGPDGRPLFAADEALRLLATWSRRSSFGSGQGGSVLERLLQRRPWRRLRRVFGDATLRDTVKPVLIPCYDLATGAAFLFSRADAMEADGYDFRIREVCAATCADPASSAVYIRSTDGRTRIAAVGGGVAMGNPAASAITHVLNNKQEFPFAVGVDDLIVLSLGTNFSAPQKPPKRPAKPTAELVRIAVDGTADMVDQAIAMAFEQNRMNNYVRIQDIGFGSSNSVPKTSDLKCLMHRLEEKLSQRNVESLLFRGKKVSEQTNCEKLEWFAGELIKEDEKRKKSLVPVVMLKQQVITPSTSSVVTATSRSSAS
ncbi:patatin-like protein 3 [Zingiber officinale]|uniref:PNPLA domain-containing protein n=1 Tax=Zingiber officinale TaxID=94328 RepID=A0A8J5KZN4_ZINOF|nr:patatin-like protein 3 [Zingiber officinale]KAG6498957.1 hypothetical protein ZIOFF_038710 [Zingiber officinale]